MPFFISCVGPTFLSRSFPDTTRGVLNEGGLFGERAGWHLPALDTSRWVERDLSAGLPDGVAGVGFFVTTFPLNIPPGFDADDVIHVRRELPAIPCVPVRQRMDDRKARGEPRVSLFTNLRTRTGMLPTRARAFKPQFKFPVHQGILDYNGTKYVLNKNH